MWYKNIAGRFFGLVTDTRVTDGQTDRITTPKTAMRRAVKTISSTQPSCRIQISTVDVINIAADRQKFITHRRTKLTAPETISRSRDMVVSAKI